MTTNQTSLSLIGIPDRGGDAGRARRLGRVLSELVLVQVEEEFIVRPRLAAVTQDITGHSASTEDLDRFVPAPMRTDHVTGLQVAIINQDRIVTTAASARASRSW